MEQERGWQNCREPLPYYEPIRNMHPSCGRHINAVLKHYEDYIAVLATKQLYDDYGNPYLCVDEGIKRRLETKLITAILSFDFKTAA